MNEEFLVILIVVFSISLFLALGVGAYLVARDTIRKEGRWGINLNQVLCPECGEPAPTIRSPRNRRQALWGGCTCKECGTEYDKWGKRIELDENSMS